MIYPDYGALMLSLGYDGVGMSFYDVPIWRLSVVRPGLFTCCVNLPYDGIEYAVSFDFPHTLVVELCRSPRNPGGDGVLRSLASLEPGQSLDLPPGWCATIKSRLGSPEDGKAEMFVPLVVEAVL